MNLFLGIDLGTSYYKLGLFDARGELVGLGRVAAPMRVDDATPIREISVAEFWAALRAGLSQALQQAGCTAAEIRGVSYASQANTFLLLDENDSPLTSLVSWTDRRADALDPAIMEFWTDADFIATTGLGIPAGIEFAVMKLRWFQTHQPDLWRRVKRVMSLSDYLTFCLTGRHAGDASTAALLGLLDVPNLGWWPVALKAAGLTPEQLSTPYRTGSTIGEITAEGSALLGAPAGAKFVAGGLDHYIAALGAGVGQLAPVSISLGTVLACLACSETYHPQANCILGPARRAGEYYQLAFDENGASMLEWYRNTFAPDASFAELSEQAGNVSPGCDGLVFDNKKFHGAKPSHAPGHHARAIMESTARTAKELIASLCGNQAVARVVATGGGAQSDVWLGILSDICGAKFLPALCKEAAVRGAAMLAVGG